MEKHGRTIEKSNDEHHRMRLEQVVRETRNMARDDIVCGRHEAHSNNSKCRISVFFLLRLTCGYKRSVLDFLEDENTDGIG